MTQTSCCEATRRFVRELGPAINAAGNPPTGATPVLLQDLRFGDAQFCFCPFCGFDIERQRFVYERFEHGDQ